MAKDPKSKQPSAAIRLAANKSLSLGYNLKQIDLFTLNMTQELPVDREEAEGKAIFEGTAFITPVDSEYPAVVVFVTFAAKREPSRKFGSNVSATYVCIAEIDEKHRNDDSKKMIAEHIGRNHAWQKFKDMLGFIVVQGNLNMPKPPMSLDTLKLQDRL